MTPAQIIGRLVTILLVVASIGYVYRQVAVVLPETRAALKAQKELTAAAEKERDEAKQQTKDLQADQADIATREAENEAERRRLADLDAVQRRLMRVCQRATGQLPSAKASPRAAGELAPGRAQAGDPGDGDALADLAEELREVPGDDDNHAALAEQWCKVKAERGEPQPGCQVTQRFATNGM